MFYLRRVDDRLIPSPDFSLASRWTGILYKKISRVIHLLGPTLLALAFASASSRVALAQGTMDFSGAQTLMGTFNWRNDYFGVEQWSRNIVRDHYVCLLELHKQHERFAETWNNNLRLQGFVEAFTDAAIRG
jgi:hypothetical protein